jgi:pimeloyl-ACP methyl ester carboxylesterase
MPRAIRLFSTLAATIVSLNAVAQENPSTTRPTIDNFVHATGTPTAPLGHLGNYQKRGNGPLSMILIPGAAFDWRVWESFMARNEDRYTMYAITPAGYGGTAPPPMPEKPDEFSGQEWTRGLCDALIDLIKTEKLDRPVLVANHYLADNYALRIALDHPDLVRGVVVIAGRGTSQYPTKSHKPGEPVGPATPEERCAFVARALAPMYRSVDADTWRMGSFKADTFCRDKARAAALWDQMVAVPRQTQIRYMLECSTLDNNREMDRIACPVLVIDPEHPPITLESVMAKNPDMWIKNYGSMETARKVWGDKLAAAWGDLDTGVRRMYDPTSQWEEVAARVKNVRLVRVADTGTFVMEDQPAKLDELIAAFVAPLSKGASK